MSRFDIFFLIFDEKNNDEDYQIAKHIFNMHRIKDQALNPDFKIEDSRPTLNYAEQLTLNLQKKVMKF